MINWLINWCTRVFTNEKKTSLRGYAKLEGRVPRLDIKNECNNILGNNKAIVYRA